MTCAYPMIRVTKDDFRALKSKIKAKRLKRDIKLEDNLELAQKAAQDRYGALIIELAAPAQREMNRRLNRKIGPVSRLIKRGPLKKQIVRLLGLLDRKRNGPLCRLMDECPQTKNIGYHNGDTSYHLVSQGRGDAARFDPEGVIWTCGPANFGEMMNRSLYREKAITLFGRERIERLEHIAKTTKKYSMADLLTLREDIKGMVEG